MIIIEMGMGGLIKLHNGFFEVTGPYAEVLEIIVKDAVKRAHGAPEFGDPDFNAAMFIIKDHNGTIIEHEIITKTMEGF